jgi:hypothetical protein
MSGHLTIPETDPTEFSPEAGRWKFKPAPTVDPAVLESWRRRLIECPHTPGYSLLPRNCAKNYALATSGRNWYAPSGFYVPLQVRLFEKCKNCETGKRQFEVFKPSLEFGKTWRKDYPHKRGKWSSILQEQARIREFDDVKAMLRHMLKLQETNGVARELGVPAHVIRDYGRRWGIVGTKKAPGNAGAVGG